MQLQLALDTPDADAMRRLLDRTASSVDIIELGTPLLIRYGIGIVSSFKRDYPDKRILADLKIVDAGATESSLAFDAGADIVTVLGTAHRATLEEAGAQARRAGGEVMADLITATDADTASRLARSLDALGMDYICLHRAFDIQDRQDSNMHLEGIESVGAWIHRAGLAIAGGLNPQAIGRLSGYKPQIVVVGGYVTRHEDPGRAVREIRQIMDGTDEK